MDAQARRWNLDTVRDEFSLHVVISCEREGEALKDASESIHPASVLVGWLLSAYCKWKIDSSAALLVVRFFREIYDVY